MAFIYFQILVELWLKIWMGQNDIKRAQTLTLKAHQIIKLYTKRANQFLGWTEETRKPTQQKIETTHISVHGSIRFGF